MHLLVQNLDTYTVFKKLAVRDGASSSTRLQCHGDGQAERLFMLIVSLNLHFCMRLCLRQAFQSATRRLF